MLYFCLYLEGADERTRDSDALPSNTLTGWRAGQNKRESDTHSQRFSRLELVLAIDQPIDG